MLEEIYEKLDDAPFQKTFIVRADTTATDDEILNARRIPRVGDSYSDALPLWRCFAIRIAVHFAGPGEWILHCDYRREARHFSLKGIIEPEREGKCESRSVSRITGGR